MKSNVMMAALAAGVLSTASAFSAPIVLTFEGATSFSSVANFYNGGTDSAGASGTNYGISFGGDILAVSNDALGPYYSNAPTNGTVMGPVGTDSALNAGFGFARASFFYSSLADAAINVYSGLNGTGNLLGTFTLLANAQNGCSDSPFCHWSVASLDLVSAARSIQFGSAAGLAAFDNVSVTAAPVPGIAWLMIAGFGAMTFTRRRK